MRAATIAAQTVAARRAGRLQPAAGDCVLHHQHRDGAKPLDLGRDFAPIGLVGDLPFVLVVHPSLAAKSLAELIALAKANPGKLNYASSGIGTPPHLAGELFKSMAGIDIVHVPFREANSGLNAVVSGAVQMMFSIASTATVADRRRHRARHRRHVAQALAARSGAARAGGIGSGRLHGDRMERFRRAQGNAGSRSSASSTPPCNAGLDDPELRQRLASAGYEPAARNSPDEFATFIRSDTAKWVALVEKTSMKSQ